MMASQACVLDTGALTSLWQSFTLAITNSGTAVATLTSFIATLGSK